MDKVPVIQVEDEEILDPESGDDSDKPLENLEESKYFDAN